MAEGDTILRLTRRIERELAGQAVNARAPHPRGHAARVERLDGMTLTGTGSHGKHLFIHFADPQLVLHSHLGMNGGWHIYRQGERWRRSEHNAWLVLSVPEKNLDLVQFGGPTLRLLRPEVLSRDPVFTSLGPDILAPEPIDVGEPVRALRKGGGDLTLGEALLDQGLVAGIGNIFKSEGCFAARLDPWRRLGEISDRELEEVIQLTREMMLASVEGAPRPRHVYRRAGEPCRRCRGRIRSRGQGEANRTTYWCPDCQA